MENYKDYNLLVADDSERGFKVISTNNYAQHLQNAYGNDFQAYIDWHNSPLFRFVGDTSKSLELSSMYEITCSDLELITSLKLHFDDRGFVFRTKTEATKRGWWAKNSDTGYIKFRNQKPMSHSTFIDGFPGVSYNSTEGKRYTFGVELETSTGAVPVPVVTSKRLNLNCERDGSVDSGEYITGVLQGDAGFIQLHNVLQVLQKRCKIDKKCGVHVHIGGAEFNKAFSVFSFILGRKLEDEVFSTLPKSRTDNKYCDKLAKLNMPELSSLIHMYGRELGVEVAYDTLYQGMTYGDLPSKDNNRLKPHKFGRYCGQYNGIEMERNFRYKWLNLIACNFNMKGAHGIEGFKRSATLEFRNHSASLNFNKIKNWILFCMAFTNYVENHQNEILKNDTITLEDIFKAAYPKKYTKLVEYFEGRKEEFYKGAEEAKEPKVTYKKIKELCA